MHMCEGSCMCACFILLPLSTYCRQFNVFDHFHLPWSTRVSAQLAKVRPRVPPAAFGCLIGVILDRFVPPVPFLVSEMYIFCTFSFCSVHRLSFWYQKCWCASSCVNSSNREFVRIISSMFFSVPSSFVCPGVFGVNLMVCSSQVGRVGRVC